MKARLAKYGVSVILAAALFSLAAIPAAAQDAPHKLPDLPVKPTPRTADGHPDFSGMWIEGYMTSDNYFDNPYPYKPEAAAKVRELYKAGDTDPLLHCLPYGYPRNLGGAHPIMLIQTPNQMAILYERDTMYRVFPTDGRPHWEGADPSYMGDSVGKWDGDTLVVDIASFNDISWLPAGEGTGAFHSDALHVIEKYTRKDSNNMDIAMTFEDPQVFTRPYNTVHHMHLVPGEHFYEDVTCTNEKDLKLSMPLTDDIPHNLANKPIILGDKLPPRKPAGAAQNQNAPAGSNAPAAQNKPTSSSY
jgi:hypothetical protein